MNVLQEQRLTVRVQAVPVLDKNKAQLCCSERTSGTGYYQTACSRSNCTRVTDRYRIVFGKLPQRKNSGRSFCALRSVLIVVSSNWTKSFYYYKKKSKRRWGTVPWWAGDITVLRLNTGITANTSIAASLVYFQANSNWKLLLYNRTVDQILIKKLHLYNRGICILRRALSEKIRKASGS